VKLSDGTTAPVPDPSRLEDPGKAPTGYAIDPPEIEDVVRVSRNALRVEVPELETCESRNEAVVDDSYASGNAVGPGGPRDSDGFANSIYGRKAGLAGSGSGSASGSGPGSGLASGSGPGFGDDSGVDCNGFGYAGRGAASGSYLDANAVQGLSVGLLADLNYPVYVVSGTLPEADMTHPLERRVKLEIPEVAAAGLPEEW
jgi:hypothetical protein